MSRLVACRFLLVVVLMAACRYEPIAWELRDAAADRRETGAATPAPDALVAPAADAAAPGDAEPATTADAESTDAPPTTIPMPMPMPTPADASRPADTSPDVGPTQPPAPKCGNGVVERGETCEPVAECNRRQAACQSDANTIRTGSGSAAACTFVCNQSPRPCGPRDGQCPAGCAKDPDCLPRPTDCTHLEWCVKPTAPNQGKVICATADNARCTDEERIAECAREAVRVCGGGHAKPIIYVPPIGGRTSG
jgi:hypothetical protein